MLSDSNLALALASHGAANVYPDANRKLLKHQDVFKGLQKYSPILIYYSKKYSDKKKKMTM